VSCAARCTLRRLGVRAGSLPTASRHESSVPFAPATSEREPSPRSASRAVRPPRTAQRSVARPPAERTYRGPSPYYGVTVSSYFDVHAMEPAGYKGRPLSTHRPTSSSAIGASTESSPSYSFPQPCGTLAAFTRIPWIL
jgi:hypothetical protein